MPGKIIQFRKQPTSLDKAMNDLQRLVDDVGRETKINGIAVVLLVEDEETAALTMWNALEGHHNALLGVLETVKLRIFNWMER